MTKVVLFFCFLLICQTNCGNSSLAAEKAPPSAIEGEAPETTTDPIVSQPILVGAERLDQYLPLLQNKRLALMVNQTSMVGATHLVDTLQRLGQDLKCIFAPEHGFRDMASDGETIEDGHDIQSGLPIISLYGPKKAPTPEDLAGVDLIIFDIQDVGARFYTYISSLHYLMRAAAQNQVPVMVLDRPNPNGHIIDGPVLDTAYNSFVGVHRVPICHGMTVGEYALMANGQGWLQDGLKADLQVITCANYQHDRPYELPVPPSPNLPNQRAIYLYPSFCFFEGTVASIGRGTNMQFQVIGHPDFPQEQSEISFTPTPGPGSRYPKLEGDLCFGLDFRGSRPHPIGSGLSESRIGITESDSATDVFATSQAASPSNTGSIFTADPILQAGFDRINLQPLINMMQTLGSEEFINRPSHFDRLAGSDLLRTQLMAGLSEAEIRASWQDDLATFKAIRSQYLLYP